MAHIYIDYDDTPTGEARCCSCTRPDLAQYLSQSQCCCHLGPDARLIKERFQPATHPKVEELHLLHYDTG